MDNIILFLLKYNNNVATNNNKMKLHKHKSKTIRFNSMLCV